MELVNKGMFVDIQERGSIGIRRKLFPLSNTFWAHFLRCFKKLHEKEMKF